MTEEKKETPGVEEGIKGLKKQIKEFESFIAYPDDELFDFFMNQDLDIPDYIRYQIQDFRIELRSLDTYGDEN